MNKVIETILTVPSSRTTEKAKQVAYSQGGFIPWENSEN